MTAGNKSRVSIGLCVFNVEKYLKETLDSIMAQTYQDFELIISDNASTDRTEQTCQECASKEQMNFSIIVMKKLLALRNFNRVFELSSKKYLN